jgi:cephalosporin-C deacetylase-like acetyl esterase
MTALLTGSTLVGGRARDIVRGVEILAARPDVDSGRISGLGRQGGAIPLLHAAALEPRLGKLVLDGMLVSYDAAIRQRVNRNLFEQVIPGVLQWYDLPDLAAALAPRQVLLVDTVDPVGLPVPAAEVQKRYPGARAVRRAADENPALAYRSFL